jgi:hypothetical protein
MHVIAYNHTAIAIAPTACWPMDRPRPRVKGVTIVATDNLPATQPSASTAVALFQRAHGRMTTLQRIDEQVSVLLEQRRRIQEELRAVQGLINEEFDRLTETSSGAAGVALARISESASRRDRDDHADFIGSRLDEEVVTADE